LPWDTPDEATEGRLDVNALAADEVVAVRDAVADELRAGRLLEAQSLCLRALERGADTPELLHLMALVSQAAGQLDHAVEWASRAIRKVPDPTYLTTLGTALRGQGRRDEALQVFDKAVQLKPDDAELWSILGNALVEAGRLPDALLCFRHTLSLDPRRGDAAFKAGHILHGMEQFEEALVLLNRSAELQPDHVPTLQARAVVLKGLNRIEDAIADNMPISASISAIRCRRSNGTRRRCPGTTARSRSGRTAPAPPTARCRSLRSHASVRRWPPTGNPWLSIRTSPGPCGISRCCSS
jgi:tetratricopeptide (TPR) repeat protein